MKRSTFLLVAAIIPLLFGLVMMLIPEKMLSNSLNSEANLQIFEVLHHVFVGGATYGG